MSDASVVTLPSDRIDEVVEVLAESFFNYPTMRYILKGSGPQYPTRLRALVGYFARSRSLEGSPVLGVEVGEPARLVAAALVDPPEPLTPSQVDQRSALVTDLGEAVGEEALQRLTAFDEAISPLEPEHGVYYLGMVGVLSGFRGRGYSRLLMDRVTEMSARDPKSKGVLLTTEHESNIPLYEAMGFTTLGETHTPDRRLYSWTMFRPD